MENYQSIVKELKGNAISKYGLNNGYDISTLVGAKSIWEGKTCLDVFSGTLSFSSQNTFVYLDKGSVDRVTSNALNFCEVKGNGSCMVIFVNNNCVLDLKPQVVTAMPKVQAPSIDRAQQEINLIKAKEKCAELGFKVQTEEFGKCVLTVSK
jgi:hypothetical protein